MLKVTISREETSGKTEDTMVQSGTVTRKKREKSWQNINKERMWEDIKE
jgi:hypothetical protein